LFLPLITSLIVRKLSKDSFKTKSTLPWHQSTGIAIVWYVVTIGISLLIATSSGVYSLNQNTFDPAILVGVLVSALVKNIVEELVWRGYLTPKLDQLGLKKIYNHLTVGVTWALWHIPYLTLLNPQLSGDLLPYLPQFIISIIAVSYIYGELRLRTGSTFYPWMLHVVNNVITGTLVTFSLLNYKSGSKLLFSPFDGLVYTVITIGLSFVYYTIFFTKNNN
jgi:membrane protease YdiL (CAAX protease family)